MMTEHPTRRDLLDAALRLFARDGYDATSTRAIAAEAETNISSIAYHFGGKEGLRLACADAVAQAIGRWRGRCRRALRRWTGWPRAASCAGWFGGS